MERGFNKIILVSLCDGYTRKVGKILSHDLGMLFCDSKDLLEYELIDRNAIKKFCTHEYLESAETMVFKHIASYENVLVTINYDNLIHNINILKRGSLIVFLKLPHQMVEESGSKINAIAYGNSSKELEKIATLTLIVRKTEEKYVCDKLIDELGGIL